MIFNSYELRAASYEFLNSVIVSHSCISELSRSLTRSSQLAARSFSGDQA